jgi:hypothetical protein
MKLVTLSKGCFACGDTCLFGGGRGLQDQRVGSREVVHVWE